MMQLHKYWNGKILGLPKGMQVALGSIFMFVLDKLTTVLWKANLAKFGSDAIVQSFVTIRYPGNISIGDEVNIGRHAVMVSDFTDSHLAIGKYSLIGRDAVLDFSGNLTIGKNVVISEGVSIYTHSHGTRPKSRPIKKSLSIQDNVWIGAHSIVLESTGTIGQGSVIAAGAVITKDVAPNTLVAGVPGRFISRVRK